MDSGGNPAVGFADQLALQYLVASLDHRVRHAADALVQRYDETRR